MSENELKTPEDIAKFRTEMAEEAWGDDAPKTTSPVVGEAETEEAETVQTEEPKKPEESAGEPPPEQDEEVVGLKQLYKVIDGLDYRVKQAESRLGSATNEIHRLKGELATAAAQQVNRHGGEAPTKQQIEEARKDSEKWDKLRDSFPEWREVFDVLETNEAPQIDLNKFRDEVRAELQTDFTQQLTKIQKGFEVRLVDVRFPSWQKDVQTPEFNTWKQNQPPGIQSLANSDRSEDAISMLEMFYQAQGIDKRETAGPTAAEIQASRDKRLHRSGTPKATGKAIKTKAVEDMSDAEYREWLAANPDKI